MREPKVRADDPFGRLMRDLLVERFADLTPEWHPSPAERRDAALMLEAQSLRLVVDNDRREAS